MLDIVVNDLTSFIIDEVHANTSTLHYTIKIQFSELNVTGYYDLNVTCSLINIFGYGPLRYDITHLISFCNFTIVSKKYYAN